MSDIEETEILFELVKLRFGYRLNDKQLIEVKEKINEIINSSEKLREIPLKNSDEPNFIFKPYLEEEN
jgi:hypothetical protein